MKALKIVGGVLLLSIIAIGVLLAVGIPSGLVTGAIEKRIEDATGYQIDIDGGATVGLWPLTTVTLNDVSLYDPADHELGQRLRAETIRAELSLRGLLTGMPRVRELAIVRPIVTLPMSRERVRSATSPGRSDIMLGPEHRPFAIDRITVSDATVVFKDVRNRVESRIDKLNAKGIASPGRKLDVTLDGRAGDQIFKMEAKATVPSGPLDGLTVPLEFKLDAAGLLPQTVSGAGEMKLNGSTVSINSLSGTLGPARFSGYASVEATAKPFVKLDLDFKKLDLETPSSLGGKPAPAKAGETALWSDEPIKLDGMNYVDADIKISASELNIGSMNLAPAKIESTVTGGILRMTVSDIGLYEGQAALGLAIDASIATPIYALRADLRDVRALPLLTRAADFTWLDGKMQTQFDIRATGRTQRELVSSLAGTTVVDFRDGQIRGINVAQMIRSLTSTTLNGWQDDSTQTTDLSELHATFRIENGKATTTDLRLAGPLVRVGGSGTIDVTTKSLAFRLEPKLVMTTQGQGSTATDPLGLGVPVVLEGSWSAPRIYPDMAGILDNPDAAFAKLREMGQGLFGPGLFGNSGKDGQGTDGNKLIEGIGSLIQGLRPPQAANDAGKSGAAPPAQQPSAQPNAAPNGTQPAPRDQIDSIIRQLFGR